MKTNPELLRYDVSRKGGEVKAMLQVLKGEKFICEGCKQMQKVDRLHGWTHTKGLLDAKGVHWYCFYSCPKCGYETPTESLKRSIYR